LARRQQPLAVIEFGLTALALAVSIYYTPDYLHLTVNDEKRQRWEIKIRWRLIGAVLILGLFSLSGAGSAFRLVAAAGWLTAANLLAAKGGAKVLFLILLDDGFHSAGSAIPLRKPEPAPGRSFTGSIGLSRGCHI
jgi:hypothetical protein